MSIPASLARDNRKLISIGKTIGKIFSDITGATQQQGVSAKEAKKNREFQERMSSTSHFREVADLRKAGLNPILSANTGASTPSGSTGAMSKADPGSLINAVTSASQLKAQLKNTNANTALQNTNSALNNANTAKSIAETKSIQNTIDIKRPLAGIGRGVAETTNVIGKGIGHAYGLADDAANYIEKAVGTTAKTVKSGVADAMDEIKQFAKKSNKWKAIYDAFLKIIPRR